MCAWPDLGDPDSTIRKAWRAAQGKDPGLVPSQMKKKDFLGLDSKPECTHLDRRDSL